jgi:AraC-like DNA-binding protein
LFIQVLRAHIASGPERNKGWLRAIFDPQMGTALSAIHGSVNTPWTVESLAEAAGMSRSAFAARFKELLGQTPLEYVTEWRMQKAMQLLQQRDKKLIDVARSVTGPTLRSVRRSSELSGPTLVNTSNVVLKVTLMPESWKIF